MNFIFSHYRYGISFKTVAGESKLVTEEMTARWKEKTLSTVLSRYALNDIFNADDFTYFIFLIGKPQNPRCFQGIKQLTLSISIPVEKLDVFSII